MEDDLKPFCYAHAIHKCIIKAILLISFSINSILGIISSEMSGKPYRFSKLLSRAIDARGMFTYALSNGWSLNGSVYSRYLSFSYLLWGWSFVLVSSIGYFVRNYFSVNFISPTRGISFKSLQIAAWISFNPLFSRMEKYVRRMGAWYFCRHWCHLFWAHFGFGIVLIRLFALFLRELSGKEGVQWLVNCFFFFFWILVSPIWSDMESGGR